MNPKCRQQVEQHIGRALKDSEVKKIDAANKASLSRLARKDINAFRAMSNDVRHLEASKIVMQDLQREATAEALRKTKQLQKRIQSMNFMESLANTAEADGGVRQGAGKHNRAVIRMAQQLERQWRGEQGRTNAALADVWDKMERKHGYIPFLNDAGADAMEADIVREIFGHATNNAAAKDIAQQLSDVMEGYRVRMNQQGANIGKLEHYVPQSHDVAELAKAGSDKWVDDILPRLDRNQYVDPNTGDLLNDAEMRTVLKGMYDTLTTDGDSKLRYNAAEARVEGVGGTGASNLAKAAGAHRSIHFKDADSFLAYNDVYGRTKAGGLFADHMEGQAKNTTLVEQLGGNPGATVDQLIARANMLDNELDKTLAAGGKMKPGEGRKVGAVGADQVFNNLLGSSGNISVRAANVAKWLSGYHAMMKLTRTTIRALFQDGNSIIWHAGETAGFQTAAKALKVTHAVTQQGRDSRQALRRMGVASVIFADRVRSGSHTIAGKNRILQSVTPDGVGRGAETVMRWSGLKQLTDANSQAGQFISAAHLSEASKKPWDKLEPGERMLLGEVGFTEKDWANVQRMQSAEVGGVTAMDAASVDALGLPPEQANELRRKVLGYIWEGGNKVTNERDLLANTIMRLGTDKGSIANAVLSQMAMFKGVAANVTANLLRRTARQQTIGGKVGVVVSYATTMGVAGYMGDASLRLMAGQDIPDPTDFRTITSSMLVGGGLAMFGDLVQMGMDSQSPGTGSSSAWRVLGPTGSDAGNLLTLGKNVAMFMQGDDDAGGKAGYQALRLVRNNLPFTNLWYTKAAVDHLLYNDIAEAISPGYQERMRGFAEKQGAQYYYTPSGDLRAPGVGQYPDKGN
jgi:hypothetical protein